MVYAMDGNWFSELVGAVHKIASPSTYPCQLCKLTHGPVSARPAWSQFIKNSNIRIKPVHRDQLRLHPELGATLPAVYRETSAGLQLLLGPAQLAECQTADELVTAIKTHLN
jgi:hypothetical protein